MNIIYDFFESFTGIWFGGGILMWPLLLITVFIYWTAFDMLSKLSAIAVHDGEILQKEGQNKLDTSILPSDVARTINDIMGEELEQDLIRNRFAILKAGYIPYIDRRIVFLGILTGVTPLLGLLGTVMGMLTTFADMGQYNVNSVDTVAGGISEALITTQTGLIVAIPALFMIMLIQNKRNKLLYFLNQLESFCCQHLMQFNTLGSVK